MQIKLKFQVGEKHPKDVSDGLAVIGLMVNVFNNDNKTPQPKSVKVFDAMLDSVMERLVN